MHPNLVLPRGRDILPYNILNGVITDRLNVHIDIQYATAITVFVVEIYAFTIRAKQM
jgi:hypothetical protein